MNRAMRTKEEWSHNVGTEAFPVSFLHEYSVGLIWDLLHANTGPVHLPLLDGSQSDNLMDGVDKVIIPDALQAIAGYIPDISLLQDSRPIKCIEVVVTNPVTDQKATAIKNLGVELLQVPVRSETELRALFPETPVEKSWWWAKYNSNEEAVRVAQKNMGVSWRTSRQYRILEGQKQADRAITEFWTNLSKCSPEIRRALVARLLEMDNLESLYPIRPDNPKYKSLQQGQ